MKKNFKTKALIMTLLVGMIAITGCGQGKKADDKIVIGLSMNTLNNPFFVDVKDGVEKGAKDNGMDIIITDAQNDPSKQMADVENLIQKKVDIILIDPADSDAIVAAIEIANEAGIPVITMDREANGGIVVSHLGFNAIKSGNIAGDFIAETALKHLNAEEVEKTVILDSNLVTSDNVDSIKTKE